MKEENLVINGMWIGEQLSIIELLCIHSFVARGHKFHLWTYGSLNNVLPENVVIKDASLIIPRDKVFSYREKNQFGHGKGSYAGFSDIFRYKLLYEFGGWWTDMDVCCLSPLDFEDPYVFRTHHDFPVVGNLMKCPQAAELMRDCYERSVNTVDSANRDWNLPIRILNEGISRLGLQGHIRCMTNQDSWRYVRNLLYRNPKIPASWKALHLVNEEWRRNRINKNAIPRRSYLGRQLHLYGLKTNARNGEIARNYFRIIFPRNTVVQAYWLVARIFWKTVRIFRKERTK